MTRPLSRWQALALGLVAAVGVGIGGWRLATLPRNGWGSDTIVVSAPFRNVAGLRTGTRVHLQGVDVGEVTAVELPAIAGDPVTVTMRVASHLQSRLGTDARVSIGRDNPLGDRVVALAPGAVDAPRLHDGAQLVGDETPDLFASLSQTANKLNALLVETEAALAGLRKGERHFAEEALESAARLNQVLSRLDRSLESVEAGKGSLGKLLKDDRLYDELTAAARELKSATYEIRQGEGTLAALVKDRSAYEKTLEAVEEMRGMVASVKQNSDAVKNLPVVRNYVVDVNKELVRPDMKRLRKIYAEDELFEPGRAVLTDAGRRKLTAAAEWLKGTTTGEVVVASIAAPQTNAAFAQTVTHKQAEAVRDFLVEQNVHRTGWWWWSTRPVRSIGCGNQPPALPETESLPASRVEVILFLSER